MKIAILHDYFDKRGGGERLVLNLAKSIDADIYTGFIDYKKTFDANGLKIISLEVSKKWPQLIRNFLIARKFYKYNFPYYDAFIISGVWCISASKNHPSILYCHTPPRFMYDLKEYFLNNANPLGRFILKKFIKYWKPKNHYYMKQFDKICPNSDNVKKRILSFYGKELYDKCEVVYTGIETKRFCYKKAEDFYLSTSRLDSLKRINLIINAFKKMSDKKLLITGTGPEEKKLKNMAKGYNNIIFLGSVSEKELLGLYARCKAVIAANVDEDLGLSPIESHAAGKPAIVVREGGFLETVNSQTGVFFSPNTNSLMNAIKKCEKKKWNHKLIQKSARQFDIKVFTKKMMKIVKKNIN